MARIIVTIVLLVALAVLITMNLGYSSPVNLFGFKFESVPTVVVGILSFVLGVIYSFALYFVRFLSRSYRKGLKKRDQDVRKREEQLQQARRVGSRGKRGRGEPPAVAEPEAAATEGEGQSAPPETAAAAETAESEAPPRRGRGRKKKS
jgi:uncharacterized integral membrane protein